MNSIYDSQTRKTFNHWDLYRLEINDQVLQNLDFWNILNQEKTINFIEWANKVKLEYYVNNTSLDSLINVNLSISNGDIEEQRICTISFFDTKFKIIFDLLLINNITKTKKAY